MNFCLYEPSDHQHFCFIIVGTFAVAWVMTKFTEPLRLATTVVIVPPIARIWNKLVANKIDDDVTSK